jgi:hypothetical protein
MRPFLLTSIPLLFALLPLGAGCGSGDDDDGLSCGPGTHDEGGVCIPDGTTGDAPSVSAIEPASGLVGGGEPFTITGTGFENAGDTTVMFGDSVAAFTIVSDTEISGTIPRASAAAVTVTVENAFGSATADFRYDGLYGADGKGAVAGNLWLVDPRDGTSVAIGPIESDDGPHAVTGLAFDAEGTLWATDATSGLDEGPAPDPVLMTIDPATARATVVGPLLQGGSTRHRSIAAITFAGSELIGWTRSNDAPVSIDTATGAVSVLGAGLGQASFGNGIVATDDGGVLVFPAGASDGAGIRGQFYTVDPASGDLTQAGILGGTGSASVCGATMFRGTVYALLCPHLAELSGSLLATVDPADGTITNVAATTALGLDAIASDQPITPASGRFVPPPAADGSTLPDVECSSSLRIALEPGATRTLAAADLATASGSTAVRTRRAGARGLPLVNAAGSRELQVVSCGGSTVRLGAADLSRYALVENSRGLIKLVDVTTGKTILRGVIALQP